MSEQSELELNQLVMVNAPDRGLIKVLAHVCDLQRDLDGVLHTVVVETGFFRYHVLTPDQVTVLAEQPS